MVESQNNTDFDLLKDKLSVYPSELANRVLDFRRAPTAALASDIVLEILRYHAPDRFDELHAAKGDTLVLVSDLGMDSLTMTEIAFEAEDFLDIVITNEEMVAIRTVAGLKNYISQAIA